MGKYTADFETTVDPLDCRVWAYAIYDINDKEDIRIGNNIDEFMEFCERKRENDVVYFHNLKFDGSFIINWLLDKGFRHVQDKKETDTKTFTTLISDKGLFYSIEVIFSKAGRKVNKVTFYDSMKLLPMSVETIAKSFKLPFSKLKIDYEAYREPDHELTAEERDYIQNDVKIVAYALHFLFSEGMEKMTTASNAMNFYKNVVSKKAFERWFPKPEYDHEVRQAYKGGFTFLNPKYKNKTVKDGIVLDVNSLYPWAMYSCPLPYGDPVFFQGEYKPDKLYNIYIQMFSCQFELKKGKIPTVQIKNNPFFRSTEYLYSSLGREEVMCMTSVDLKLFLENYDVYNLEYINGYMFKSAVGFFKDYIDHWSGEKIKAKTEGNYGMYVLSKLMLNSLYGKFATNPKIRGMAPYKEDDILKFELTEEEQRDPIYIPVGAFITAYAREKTIRSAGAVYDRFIYADTDSLHLEGLEIPEGLEVDEYKLGAWKHESTFSKGKYLRAKCYMEQEVISEDDFIKASADPDVPKNLLKQDSNGFYKIKVTCAGMPAACYEYVTFSNFKIGKHYKGRLQPVQVPGGIVLKAIDFTIRRI